MFKKYINIQLERIKNCPQSGMLGENVFTKIEAVLRHLVASITRSTETKILAQIMSDNPFAGVPELLTDEDRKKARDTAGQQIEDGELIIPELLIDTLNRQPMCVTDGFLEMLSRMDENRDAICSALTDGKVYRTIDDITFDDGDTHNNGRSVVIVHTDSGKLVYKPHDMRGDEQVYFLAERFFDEFVGIPKSIAFGRKFGVCEFIEKRCAEGHEEAERFWYSLGGLTLFAKPCGSTDLHHTNILSCGTKPYIIDLETHESGVTAIGDLILINDGNGAGFGLGIQRDGPVRKAVGGDIVGRRGYRLHAVFLRQGSLEGIIGLLQGVPVRDDGEIHADFPDRVVSRRGHGAAAVTGESARISAVARILESRLDQFGAEGRQGARDGDSLEREGRGGGSGGGRRRGRRDGDLRPGGAFVLSDSQLPFQLLDVRVDVRGAAGAGLLFRAEPAAGISGIASAQPSGKGNYAPEFVGAIFHGKECDRENDDDSK